MAMQKILALLLLPLLLNAADPALYLWHRQHKPELAEEVKKFYQKSSAKLFCLAGELNNDLTITALPMPDFVIPARSVPVIRIHIRHLSTPPEKLAELISGIYHPWRKCGELQIDLDAPEYRLELYENVMKALRRKLKNTILSATVLPCHVRHRQEFRKLAEQCEYFVLQLHALHNNGGTWSIIDRKTALRAITDAINIGFPFKTALPFYSHLRADGSVIKPDLLLVSKLAGVTAAAKAGVIGFRLGIPGEYTALDLPTVLSLCRGTPPAPELNVLWTRHGPGLWHLEIFNRGYFPEKTTLHLQWSENFIIDDADTLNHARLSLDRKQLELLLPPAGTGKSFVWLRCPQKFDLHKNNPLTITRKDAEK